MILWSVYGGVAKESKFKNLFAMNTPTKSNNFLDFTARGMTIYEHLVTHSFIYAQLVLAQHCIKAAKDVQDRLSFVCDTVTRLAISTDSPEPLKRHMPLDTSYAKKTTLCNTALLSAATLHNITFCNNTTLLSAATSLSATTQHYSLQQYNTVWNKTTHVRNNNTTLFATTTQLLCNTIHNTSCCNNTTLRTVCNTTLITLCNKMISLLSWVSWC